jgi:hypothetical protein
LEKLLNRVRERIRRRSLHKAGQAGWLNGLA